MQKITSSGNPKYKDALQLHGARGRKKQNRIIIFGRREIERAIASGVKPVQLFIADPAIDCQIEGGVDPSIVFQIPDDLFSKLNYGSRGDAMVMIADRPSTRLADLRLKNESLVLVVEAIENPGNLGGIFRSADGSGTQAVIVADPRTDIFHPNAIRNSSGAVFNVPTATGSSADVLAMLRDSNYRIAVATPEATADLHQVSLAQKVAVVLGNEAEGVSETWKQNTDQKFKLPMLGVADSLNVSVTAAIVMYESLRQTTAASANPGLSDSHCSTD